ncbi:NADPH-dependent 2,4-dienoyl-CoA reductase [Parafrigoribacterium mesophilum]|uniref:oxidoreductase n=1 Tax=Parafrigoribacterium mesophilum TaxID=433646 RepID=UPI0031FBC593
MAALRFPHLRAPLAIGTLRLPHRVLMGSMHLNLETTDGPELQSFYAERARGGAGLMITGGAAVSRAGAGGPGYALINEPEHWDRWRRVVDAVHEAGGLIGLQLFHAGRYAEQATFGIHPLGPSAVYSSYSKCTPEPMTTTQIEATIADFAAGGAQAIRLGFDAVEIMGSEGYLINQFASPVTNLRDDEWGGDSDRRRAFPTAVTAAVRAAVGSAPLLVRMSGADLVPNSSTPQEVDDLAIAHVAAGADAIDVGIGWHESRVPTTQSLVPHGVWIDVAARVRAALADAGAAVPVIGSNRVNSIPQAERIVAAGKADLVSMARPFLADPFIVSKSFSGDTALVNTCIGCNEACIDHSLGTAPVSCLVNPRAGREWQFPASGIRSGAPRSVAVVGAGPAGMEAARALAAGGAKVTLWDAGRRIGGQFLMAGMVPGKADFLETVRYFEHELRRLGVRFRLGHAVSDAAQLGTVDHVVLATGVLPRTAAVPGVGLPHVVDYPQAFADVSSIGERVAVIGAGGIAVDLAHLLVEVGTGSRIGEPAPATESEEASRFLAAHGLAVGPTTPARRKITVMRRSGSIGAGMGITTRWAVVQAIRAAGVRTITDVRYDRIVADGVWIEHDGRKQLIEADTVVIAAGQVPNDPLSARLRASGLAHTVIGGALHTSGMNAVAAFEQGLRVGTALAAG